MDARLLDTFHRQIHLRLRQWIFRPQTTCPSASAILLSSVDVESRISLKPVADMVLCLNRHAVDPTKQIRNAQQ